MNIQNVLANSDRTFQESLFAVIDGEDWAAKSGFFCEAFSKVLQKAKRNWRSDLWIGTC